MTLYCWTCTVILQSHLCRRLSRGRLLLAVAAAERGSLTRWECHEMWYAMSDLLQNPGESACNNSIPASVSEEMT